MVDCASDADTMGGGIEVRCRAMIAVVSTGVCDEAGDFISGVLGAERPRRTLILVP
jgi:hypothetical protein